MLTIVSVGYPLFPAAPDASGGAEQILVLLERGIVRAGHRSIVVAAKGSRVAGELVETPIVDGELNDAHREFGRAEHLRVLERVLAANDVDLIHFHGLDFHAYIPRTAAAMLGTLHLPLSWYPESIFQQTAVHLNCVSHTQGDAAGITVIENGIDVGRYKPALKKSDYALWLGRVCPEKAAHLAIAAAKAADIPLLIAGPVHPFPSHQEYFAQQVAPQLDEKRRYIGPVEGAEKENLLAQARCLLVTSLVAETCSLVAIEALSSATPVVALRSGALPEVVRHGVTGFIADSADDMVAALGRLGEISPMKCRAEAITRFSSNRMTADYLSLYKRILGMSSAPQEALYGSVPRRKFHAL